VGSFSTLLSLLTLDRGIAWSKWGSIAAIASNGAALELRNLRCHPENGTWALSEPTVTPNFTSTLDGGPLKHLSWSPTGSDLAVIDAAGRITILAVFSSLNKPSLSRPCQSDPADDLHGIVGCYWLNIAPYPSNRPVCSAGPNNSRLRNFNFLIRRYCMVRQSKMGLFISTRHSKDRS
jgi:mediator of RNA polymerase II transcription subunit 16